jgi:hypothetical protein
MNNAAWANTEDTTVSANAGVSPDGYTNADKLIPQATSNLHRISQVFTVTAGTPYTYSVFVKKAGYDYFLIRTGDGTNNNVGYDLVNGTVTFAASGYTGFIESYGNDWYRLGYVRSFGATSVTIFMRPNNVLVNFTSIPAFTGDGTSGAFVWGAMLEQGSYQTSYLNTLSTSVTRVADAASKTGISSLIGQTEGTLFIEGSALQNGSIDSRRISISDGSTNNRITIEWDEDSNRIRAFMSALGVTVGSTSYTGINQTNNSKIAVTYNSSAFSMFINGVKVDSDTTIGTTPIGMAQFNFSAETGLLPFQGNAKQLLIFPTALTDGQAIELTSL